MLEHPQKDFLTGFPLRDTFYSFLKELISNSESKKDVFSIALIDVDHFKKFNDKFGHSCGDGILEYAAEILRLLFHKERCFRYGGDEFIIVLPDKDREKALSLILSIKQNMLHRPFLFEDKSSGASKHPSLSSACEAKEPAATLLSMARLMVQPCVS